jgi:hypothetical protein
MCFTTGIRFMMLTKTNDIEIEIKVTMGMEMIGFPVNALNDLPIKPTASSWIKMGCMT